MKLYLSSYKVGTRIDELKKWIDEHGNKICLIPNARDTYPDNERKTSRIHADVKELTDLGFDVTIVSLKDYFNEKEKLLSKLKEFNAFYVIGGNAFVLRQAMFLSGFDEYLNTLKNDSNYLYAGYSAGICVLAKDMHGLEKCDASDINPYGIDTIWNGLGYFDYIFLPHYKSNHKETELIDICVEYCNKHNIKYKTLCDGEVIVKQTENEVKR